MIDNPTPRYYKIYRLLKQAIENREYVHDEAMPGENALAEKYGVSRLTIRRSLELLQREGLVERRQGSGTFPVAGSVRLQPLSADINKLVAHLNTMGANTHVRLLEFGYEQPRQDVQNQLALPAGSRVQKAIRVRCYEDVPFSYLLTYVPEDIGRRYTRDALERQPLQAVFKSLGLRLGSAEQSFSATVADAHHAEALGVAIASPLLCIKRVTRDTRNRPIEYLVAVYNPDRFEYRMALSNRRSKGVDTWVMDESR
ncbi:GntR family transcriptional regulator [Allopusillimonas soli]|uniref:GntR family transcriptional regulator n=1 Tax=Allopusillimonas soli TaxID=659016 RepID=A0A853FBK1_9BURK|nr:GntR family transcriptional regulator [Allopusillimonas soli]NYT37463.1 GntR family transcriptional regulator [Allopusillimonas soli]TEA74557.1 GntR family transcriptional regulator [Allopusillimonas soli]